jgi:hypothetical protein
MDKLFITLLLLAVPFSSNASPVKDALLLESYTCTGGYFAKNGVIHQSNEGEVKEMGAILYGEVFPAEDAEPFLDLVVGYVDRRFRLEIEYDSWGVRTVVLKVKNGSMLPKSFTCAPSPRQGVD